MTAWDYVIIRRRKKDNVEELTDALKRFPLETKHSSLHSNEMQLETKHKPLHSNAIQFETKSKSLPIVAEFGYPMQDLKSRHLEVMFRAYQVRWAVLCKHFSNTHGYNLAMVCVDSSTQTYLYHVRFSGLYFHHRHPIWPVDARDTKMLIPGNAADVCSKRRTRSISSSFFWNHWKKSVGMHVFGLARWKDASSSTLLTLLKVWSSDPTDDDWRHVARNDTRFFRAKDKCIFAHLTDMTSFGEVVYNANGSVSSEKDGKNECNVSLWWRRSADSMYRNTNSDDAHESIYNASILRVVSLPTVESGRRRRRMDQSTRSKRSRRLNDGEEKDKPETEVQKRTL